MLGGPRRDEQIENMIYTVRNMARAGIPIHWQFSIDDARRKLGRLSPV
jgi:D-mannonate dehydratase